MLKLIIVNIYTTIFFFSAGIFLNNQLFKTQKINNLYIHGIYGGILLNFPYVKDFIKFYYLFVPIIFNFLFIYGF